MVRYFSFEIQRYIVFALIVKVGTFDIKYMDDDMSFDSLTLPLGYTCLWLFLSLCFCTESNLGYFLDKSTIAGVRGFCVSAPLRPKEVIRT